MALKSKKSCVSTYPTDPVFCADPAVCITLQEKQNNSPTDPNIIFSKNWTNNFKNVGIAKIMLKIIFVSYLNVLNFIICMFSGYADNIWATSQENLSSGFPAS